MEHKFVEHFIVRKAKQRDIPFDGVKLPLYEITYRDEDGEDEYCSHEHIADELELAGTHMSRYHKVMKLITGNCEGGVLYYNYAERKAHGFSRGMIKTIENQENFL